MEKTFGLREVRYDFQLSVEVQRICKGLRYSVRVIRVIRGTCTNKPVSK